MTELAMVGTIAFVLATAPVQDITPAHLNRPGNTEAFAERAAAARKPWIDSPSRRAAVETRIDGIAAPAACDTLHRYAYNPATFALVA